MTKAVLSLKDVEKMATFVSRVVEHMGGPVVDNMFTEQAVQDLWRRGSVTDKSQLQSFAKRRGQDRAWFQAMYAAACHKH